MQGIRSNKRLIALIMRNNQLNGHEHAADIKSIVKDHPSLTMVDFSNSELYINKNKLKNSGAIAIVEGILETEGCSLMSEINLSYNYLTSECLPYFSKLSNPDFVQIQSLNLSYNDLGPESIKKLSPMFSNLVSLNLSNTKLNN